MALTNIYKFYRLRNYVSSTFLILRRKSMLVELDVMDDFTTQLMQKKSDKWENLKIKRLVPSPHQNKVAEAYILGDKLNTISTNELNTVFQKILDENDHYKIIALIEECTAYRKIPSDLILTNILSYFSQSADITGINKTRELCLFINSEFLTANSDFKHYLAEAIWMKGNAVKGIGLFEEVYHENPFLRRRIRLMLKYLISDAVSNHSEAVLVNLEKFSENLVKKYKDYFPMMCLWRACFLSEWFADQQIALDLIERNDNLSKMLTNHYPYVVSTALKYHKTDPVYRLLEILLTSDMKLQYSIVLVALFDYRYRQGDLNSCCEILRWSTEHKVMLPSVQHVKFLKLLLKCDSADNKNKRKEPKYELKF